MEKERRSTKMDGGVNGDKVAVLDLGIGWDLRVFYEMNRTQKRDTTDRDTAPHSLTGNSNTFKTIITYLSIYPMVADCTAQTSTIIREFIIIILLLSIIMLSWSFLLLWLNITQSPRQINLVREKKIKFLVSWK
jgi:hypothetical protein